MSQTGLQDLSYHRQILAVAPGEVHTLVAHLSSVATAVTIEFGLGGRGQEVWVLLPPILLFFQTWCYLGVIQYTKALLCQC